MKERNDMKKIWTWAVVLAFLFAASSTMAQNTAPDDTDTPRGTLGLAPGTPEIPLLSGGVTPSFGSETPARKDWQFDFHGIVLVPLRMGIGERESPGSDQKAVVFHAPPRIAGDYETFNYTAVIPDPWVQLNFSYGNKDVVATVIIAARTVSTASGYYNPPDMLGINDAFLTFHVPLPVSSLKLDLHLGAFSNRYGAMGETDLGRYTTPLLARIAGTGLTTTGAWTRDDWVFLGEAGFQGQFSKAPVGVEPAGWNGWADPNVGASYAAHLHAGFNYRRRLEVGAHLVNAFTRDDRTASEGVSDGDIVQYGLDARLTLRRFGHLYTGFAYTDADHAGSVSSVIRVLNAPGGPGLINEYLGPRSNGNGTLTTTGLQYDLSLGNLLRYPDAFHGNGPDLILSLFGIYTFVSSPDPDFDGVSRLKAGAELTYAPLKWFAVGTRYDQVMPVLDDASFSQGILTGRLIFHSDWNSRDQVSLQYSWVRNGSNTAVREGYPPVDDPAIIPDAHVLCLAGSLWW
jgi:hypothetical protein